MARAPGDRRGARARGDRAAAVVADVERTRSAAGAGRSDDTTGDARHASKRSTPNPRNSKACSPSRATTRVGSGAAVEVGANLDAELARIDAALRQPNLGRDGQLALWHARVDTLRSAVSFESTRRWMAVHGEGYDGALVRVD